VTELGDEERVELVAVSVAVSDEERVELVAASVAETHFFLV
jgi:hypothetical protein